MLRLRLLVVHIPVHLIDPQGFGTVAHHPQLHLGVLAPKVHQHHEGDVCRLCHGVAIDPRGNGGEVHAFAAVCKSQFQAGLVAGAQQRRLTVVAAPPNRAGGMDHIAAGEIVGGGDLRLARLAAP